MQHYQLTEELRKQASSMMELKQLSSRLKKLLKDRLAQISAKMDPEFTATKRERLALIEEEYQSYLNEYIEVAHTYRQARVKYDSYRRLLAARQSEGVRARFN